MLVKDKLFTQQLGLDELNTEIRSSIDEIPEVIRNLVNQLPSETRFPLLNPSTSAPTTVTVLLEDYDSDTPIKAMVYSIYAEKHGKADEITDVVLECEVEHDPVNLSDAFYIERVLPQSLPALLDAVCQSVRVIMKLSEISFTAPLINNYKFTDAVSKFLNYNNEMDDAVNAYSNVRKEGVRKIEDVFRILLKKLTDKSIFFKGQHGYTIGKYKKRVILCDVYLNDNNDVVIVFNDFDKSNQEQIRYNVKDIDGSVDTILLSDLEDILGKVYNRVEKLLK